MNTIEVSALKTDMTFTSDLMLDKLFLLCTPPCPVTGDLIRALKDWSFTQLEADNTKPVVQRTEEEEVQHREEIAKKIQNNKTDDVSDLFIDKSDDPQTQKIKEQIHKLEAENVSPENKMEHVRTIYNEYMNFINRVYMQFATHKRLSITEMMPTVTALCKFIKENNHYVLRVSPSDESYNKNMIVSHSMRSTVTAVSIGLRLGMSEDKIIELAIACILHEIGQIKIPPQLYMNSRSLTPAERQQVNTHPILSYNILKEAGFPLSIQLAALDHHEKENGQGYPRHLTADKISLYAKIIAVACSFEAITAPRQYKDEKSAYAAMAELLVNEGTPYNPSVVKALLLSISTFPIGSYVYLSDGKIGLVVETNPTDPKNPIVQVTSLTGEKTLVHTSDLTTKVVRVLSQKETEDYLASMKQAAN